MPVDEAEQQVSVFAISGDTEELKRNRQRLDTQHYGFKAVSSYRALTTLFFNDGRPGAKWCELPCSLS